MMVCLRWRNRNIRPRMRAPTLLRQTSDALLTNLKWPIFYDPMTFCIQRSSRIPFSLNDLSMLLSQIRYSNHMSHSANLFHVCNFWPACATTASASMAYSHHCSSNGIDLHHCSKCHCMCNLWSVFTIRQDKFDSHLQWGMCLECLIFAKAVHRLTFFNHSHRSIYLRWYTGLQESSINSCE